ncbi:MAG: flagellar basal body-associated FliL family protein, partial [Acidimicrobiales bacterium]
LILVAVLLLLGAGYMVKGRSHKVVYKPGQPVPAGKVSSLGTLTVNTSDGHLVQVGIDLQLTKVAESKTISTDQPQLRNAAIADLGDQTYTGLLAPTGRSALQQQLLASFQQVLGPVDGAAPQVSAVYFTSFVLQ